MGRSFSNGPTIDKEAAFALLRSAVDLGVRFFDTVEAYGPFADEQLVGEALGPVRDKVVNLASPEAKRLTISMGGRKKFVPAWSIAQAPSPTRIGL